MFHTTVKADIRCENVFSTTNYPIVEPSFNGVFLGHGRFRAAVSLQNLPLKTVESLLPNGLSLDASQSYGPQGTHPIFVAFGHNTPKKTLGLPISNSIVDAIPIVRKMMPARSYEEFIIFIPYVKDPDSGELSMYSHRFLLNSLPAKIGGDYYGFPKTLGRLRKEFKNGYYRVHSKSGEALAELSFGLAQSSPTASDQKTADAMMSLFNLPTLNFRNGRFTRVYFKAELNSDALKLDFKSRLDGDLLGINRDFNFSTEHDGGVGFYVDYNWHISDRY